MLLSSTYNFVEVESKNIFGFKNYLNLGTTARIANVKGFDEFNKSALIRNLDISNFSGFRNIVLHLPKTTSL